MTLLIWLLYLMQYVTVSLPNLFCTTEWLVCIKINGVRGRPITFHLLIWLFYLLYCNITSLTSPKITLVLLLTYFL